MCRASHIDGRPPVPHRTLARVHRAAPRWPLLPSVAFFIVNVSLPSIHVSLGSSPAEAQLVVSGYAPGYAVFLITGGRLGDLYGRRRTP
jgi:MFS family permease